MRIALVIIGVILLGFGIWVVAGQGSYRSTDTVAKVGSVSLKATHDKAIPEWLGIAGIVVGGLVLIGGIASNRKR